MQIIIGYVCEYLPDVKKYNSNVETFCLSILVFFIPTVLSSDKVRHQRGTKITYQYQMSTVREAHPPLPPAPPPPELYKRGRTRNVPIKMVKLFVWHGTMENKYDCFTDGILFIKCIIGTIWWSPHTDEITTGWQIWTMRHARIF